MASKKNPNHICHKKQPRHNEISANWHYFSANSPTKNAVSRITDFAVFFKRVRMVAPGKRCDYILWYNKGTPLAIVEAKDNKHSSSFGLQQAIDYGTLLEVPFVYTSNGSSFFEHDFTTGLEKEFPLSEFPTADELMARWRGANAGKTAEAKNRMIYAIVTIRC